MCDMCAVGASVCEHRHRVHAEVRGQLLRWSSWVLTCHLLRCSLLLFITAHKKLTGQRSSWDSTVFTSPEDTRIPEGSLRSCIYT